MKYSAFQQTCKDYFRKMNKFVAPRVVAQSLKFHRKPNCHECTFEFQGIRMYLTVNERNIWELTHVVKQASANHIAQNVTISYMGNSIEQACSELFRNGGK